MNLAKRITPFVFIAIIAMVSMRYVFFTSYLQLKKDNFRATVIEERQKETLTLCFSKETIYKNTKNIEWHNKKRELVIKGAYHEIISIRETNGHYVVKVVPDKHENELLKDYFVSEKSSDNSKEKISAFLQFCFVLPEIQMCAINDESIVNFQSVLVDKINSEFKLKLIKPPQSNGL